MTNDDPHDSKIYDDQEMCSGRHCENLATRTTVRGENICDECTDAGIDGGKLCECCDGVDFADVDGWQTHPNEPAADICPNCWPSVEAEAAKEAEIERGCREEEEAQAAIRAFADARERLRAVADGVCHEATKAGGGRTCLLHRDWLRIHFGEQYAPHRWCSACQARFLLSESAKAVLA